MELEIIKTSDILGKEIKVYGDLENPLFAAKDVANWIEHSQTSRMIESVDEDEKLIGTIFLSGQKREVWMLTENGLYEILMQSRKPLAKDFKKGIKHMLKEVRTNGGYIATSETDTPEMIMAKGLQIAMKTIEKYKTQNVNLINENTRLDLKTQFVDKIIDSKQNLTLSQAAKILKLPFGRNTLSKELRNRGVFFKNSNEPKQTYVDRGYFLVFPFQNEKMSKPRNQTFVTPKGIAWLAKVFEIIVPVRKVVKIQ